MKRAIALTALLATVLLAGCGKSETGVSPTVSRGPSPYSGHDQAWFVEHPKENAKENVWCKDNNGYLNPLVKEQAKTYDPTCDIAANAYWQRMDNAKTKPGAF